MELHEVYQHVSRSVVAFMSHSLSPLSSADQTTNVAVPPIIGTGFVVASNIIMTNRHVIEALAQLPNPPDGGSRGFAVIQVQRPDGIAQLRLDLGAIITCEISDVGYYYGPRSPDVALIHTQVRELPTLKINPDAVPLEEGRRVATVGFPMGSTLLQSHGYTIQVTPALQEGIISAVLPFRGSSPHGFMINVMSQGGASGSPIVAVDRPEVVGLLYAGPRDSEIIRFGDQRLGDRGAFVISHPTCFTYSIAPKILQRLVHVAESESKKSDLSSLPTFADVIANADTNTIKRKGHPEPAERAHTALEPDPSQPPITIRYPDSKSIDGV